MSVTARPVSQNPNIAPQLVIPPPDVMLSTDIGNINSVAHSYLRFERPRSFFAPMSFGNCGYAFPTLAPMMVGKA